MNFGPELDQVPFRGRVSGWNSQGFHVATISLAHGVLASV